tara:strand:- start:210 stop:374 length:165 start_codon:yes stop_codon:yes gene_type:complete
MSFLKKRQKKKNRKQQCVSADHEISSATSISENHPFDSSINIEAHSSFSIHFVP